MIIGTESHTSPLVSTIIPIRNEEGIIRRNLEAIFAQDYPQGQLEILAIDGLSEDNTRTIVQALQADCPNLQLIDNPARFTPHALNVGLRSASGEIIIILGGHSEIASDFISQCVAALHTYDVDAVGGVIETVGETYQARVIALAMSSRFGVGGVTFRIGHGEPVVVDTVVYGAYKRKIVELAGGFDEELIRNQDDEYNYRIRKLGGKLLFSPRIRSRYFSRGSLRKLWTQYYQYGLYKVRVLQKHPRQMRPRQFAPAIFVGAVVGGGLLSLLIPTLGLLWIGVLILYLSVNILASVVSAARNGWIYLPLLPLVFATLHFSYGLGFWHGLVKFRNRWGNHDRQ